MEDKNNDGVIENRWGLNEGYREDVDLDGSGIITIDEAQCVLQWREDIDARTKHEFMLTEAQKCRLLHDVVDQTLREAIERLPVIGYREKAFSLLKHYYARTAHFEFDASLSLGWGPTYTLENIPSEVRTTPVSGQVLGEDKIKYTDSGRFQLSVAAWLLNTVGLGVSVNLADNNFHTTWEHLYFSVPEWDVYRTDGISIAAANTADLQLKLRTPPIYLAGRIGDDPPASTLFARLFGAHDLWESRRDVCYQKWDEYTDVNPGATSIHEETIMEEGCLGYLKQSNRYNFTLGFELVGDVLWLDPDTTGTNLALQFTYSPSRYVGHFYENYGDMNLGRSGKGFFGIGLEMQVSR
jgi:hypothetical protein